MFEFEEYKTVNQFWGWIIILCFSAIIIGWGVLIHAIVPDAPREWNFGSMDDTPAESVYSTQPPPDEENVPIQLETPALDKKDSNK